MNTGEYQVPKNNQKVSDPDITPSLGGDRRIGGGREFALSFLDIGNEMVSMYWHLKEMQDPMWRFYITDAPGVFLEQSGERLDYRPDRITVIPGWCPFVFHADPQVRHAFVHLSVPAWNSRLVMDFFPRALSVDEPDLLERLRPLLRRLEDGPQDLLLGAIKGWCAEMLERLVEALPAQRRRDLWKRVDHHRLAPALDFIDARLSHSIAVGELAERLGVGEAHCIRRFKAVLGLTPTQVILEKRISLALQLLLTTSLGLDDIAQRCGFPNRRYLSRMFSRRVGVPPSQYRKEHRASGTAQKLIQP